MFDSNGNTIRLANKPFAIGGEAEVFDVIGQPDLVAKLYKQPRTNDHALKLRAMTALTNNDLLKIAAWPLETLHEGNGSSIAGILMPRIKDYREIHHLYSVAQRKKDYPEADWGFLLHTARNCAIAFEAIHRYGHVIGDVNQKNVMVSPKGIVAFVDCDSFQIRLGSKMFRCHVGVPEYTPPELQGHNYASFDREPNHDLFGLAVLIFHLLMMGRHPYSGVPVGNRDIAMEQAIQAGYYAYSRNVNALRPPPKVPPLSMLDPGILDLFEKAFRAPGQSALIRPTAQQWRTTLDSAMNQLARCKNDTKHVYLRTAGQCPWCHLIATDRLMFFIPAALANVAAFILPDVDALQQYFLQLKREFESLLSKSFTTLNYPTQQISFPAGLRPLVSRPAQIPFPPAPAKPSKPESPSTKPLEDLKQEYLRKQSEIIQPTKPKMPIKPTMPPSDPWLEILTFIFTCVGLMICCFSLKYGVLSTFFFGFWFLIQHTSRLASQENQIRQLNRAYEIDCDMLNAEYKYELALYHHACKVLEEEYENKCRILYKQNYEQEIANEKSYLAACSVLEENHHKECLRVFNKNTEIQAEYDKSNKPWLDEEQKWKKARSSSEQELTRLKLDYESLQSAAKHKYNVMELTIKTRLSNMRSVLTEYKAELSAAESNSRELQFESYLDQFLIRDAGIKGITNQRVLSLESFGIETAKDVVMLNYQKVPGIGPVLTERLIEWRDTISQRFRPTSTLPASERARINARFAPALMPIQQLIVSQFDEMNNLKKDHDQKLREIVNKSTLAAQNRATAQAHLDALYNLR